MRRIAGPTTCDPTDPTPFSVTIEATIESGPERFDIGLWVNESGGSAKSDPTGTCYRDFLDPVSADNTNCSSIFPGPYYNADNDDCGDVDAQGTSPCGTDVLAPCTAGGGTCLFTTFQFTTQIVCTDSDGDLVADVGTCTSWDNNAGGTCSDELDTDPGTGSKCNCNPVDITDLHVDPCQSDCSVNNTVCATFACDPNGGLNNCAIVTFQSATTPCRVSAGVCDVAESCTGSGAACPTDVFAASTTPCRVSAGVCDVAESCTGSGPNCPADVLSPPGTQCTDATCIAGGLCDVTGECVCPEFTCRTPGFWGTHAGDIEKAPRSRNITQAVLNFDGTVEVCGELVTNTSLGAAMSALEALCVSPRGNQSLQLARQLVALALNCIMSGGASDCSDILAASSLFATCNDTCTDATDADGTNDPTTDEITGCVFEVDCLNNGGNPFLIPDVCVTGNCSETGDLCSGICLPDSGGNPQTCEPFTGNCHDQPLELVDDVGTVLLDFEPPGPAGSSNACNLAKQNTCTLFTCP